jgi:hypothetical protein
MDEKRGESIVQK